MDKRILAAGVLVFALAPATALASTTKSVPAHSHVKAVAPKVAPADEYFGRMKMSILGITNTIRDTGIRESYDPANASKYYTSLALTEDALEDWSHKYPHDGWIPRRAYDLSHDFWRMHTPQADAQAQRCRGIMFRQFPHNHWAVIARSESAAKVAPLPAAGAVAADAGKQQ